MSSTNTSQSRDNKENKDSDKKNNTKETRAKAIVKKPTKPKVAKSIDRKTQTTSGRKKEPQQSKIMHAIKSFIQ